MDKPTRLLHGRAFVHSTSKQLRLTGGSDGNLIVWKVVEHLGSGHCKSMKRFGDFSSRVISSCDKTHSGHFFDQDFNSIYSPSGWARELFKPSTDSASLLVEIEKKCLFYVCGSLWGTSQVGVGDGNCGGTFAFLVNFTRPWAPIQCANVLAEGFFLI